MLINTFQSQNIKYYISKKNIIIIKKITVCMCTNKCVDSYTYVVHRYQGDKNIVFVRIETYRISQK
jgi:hypothetical protein